MSTHLIQRIEHRVAQLVEHAQRRTGRKLTCPSIGFRRAGRNAGTAHLNRNHINFNPLYLHDNVDEYLSQVIPHEVAHIVVYQIFGRVKPHGLEWQSMMRDTFDCKPQVTHTMHSDAVTSRVFTYKCDCGQVELSVRRHNKVVRGQQQYRCKRCHATLSQTL
ncbi:SprT family zinc-dependent metalloprotease [Alteromonas sp. SM 2104]|nr:SprT family zinc-dependent metalloprotease [Alteromonas oceanisediminis]